TSAARCRWRAPPTRIRAIASFLSALTTPASSTASTPCGARSSPAWRTSTRSNAANRSRTPTRSSKRPWGRKDSSFRDGPDGPGLESRYRPLAMRTELFDFDLPADRIALRPAVPRDAARLLVVKPGGTPELEDRKIMDLAGLLRPGDCLVVNDSKVIAARLEGRRIGRGATEPAIEATLHKRIDGSHWRAFVRPAKKLEVGDTLRFGTEGKVCFLGELDAQVSQKDEGGEITLSFSFHGPVLDQAIAERGDMPLPPYIASRRAPDEQDRSDYQTLFAHE